LKLKEVIILDHCTEEKLMEGAIDRTFEGLVEANNQTREPAPLDKLVIGLECGGSDGFLAFRPIQYLEGFLIL